MKKLALLLGALSLVSSVAYAKEVVPAVEEVVVVEEAAPVAAPVLRVTSVGQYIEVDNEAGETNGDVGNVMLGHKVGLAYGDDWTFGIMARKGWDTDTDKGFHSDGHRLEIDVWKAFDNYDLGFRWRQESDKDRYYLRGKYSYGMLSGSADVWYESKNAPEGGVQDNYEMELIPVRLNYGPFGIGYFFNYKEGVGSTNNKEGDFDHCIDHQIRAYANFALTEKLSTYAEYRFGLGKENEQYGHKYDVYDAGDYHKLEVGASYALTENLSVSGYYAYELFDRTDDAKRYEDTDRDFRYGEFCIGWDYKF